LEEGFRRGLENPGKPVFMDFLGTSKKVRGKLQIWNLEKSRKPRFTGSKNPTQKRQLFKKSNPKKPTFPNRVFLDFSNRCLPRAARRTIRAPFMFLERLSFCGPPNVFFGRIVFFALRF